MVSLAQHPELRKSLLPPLIIHTAATPMSLPKSSSTGLGEVPGSGSCRTSSSGSAEPGAAHEMKSPVGGARGCSPWLILGGLGKEEGAVGCGLDRAWWVQSSPRPVRSDHAAEQRGPALGEKEQSSDLVSAVPLLCDLGQGSPSQPLRAFSVTQSPSALLHA